MAITRFTHWVKPRIVHGNPTKFGWVVLYPKGLDLQKNTDLAWGVFINAHYGVRIEEGAQLGPYVVVTSDNTINNTRGPIIIKRNARVGAFALLLPNVVIEENEFVKAHSIRKGTTWWKEK